MTMSLAHPILFSGPMVRAILEGRKTQTRRIVKPHHLKKPKEYRDQNWPALGKIRQPSPGIFRAYVSEFEGVSLGELRPPHGIAGDRLWVREKARTSALRGFPGVKGSTVTVTYAADRFEIDYPCESEAVRWFPNDSHNADGSVRWTPAIFMPRWASRITLEVTDVRVQRLQEISEADAVAEGCAEIREGSYVFRDTRMDASGLAYGSAVMAYACLWDEINGEDSWNANPWVWAYTFKRVATCS